MSLSACCPLSIADDKRWVPTNLAYVNGSLRDSSGSFGAVCIGVPKANDGTPSCVLKIMRPFKSHGDERNAFGILGHAQNLGLDSSGQPPTKFSGMDKSEYERELTIMTYIQQNIHSKNKSERFLQHDALVQFYEGWVEEEFPPGIYEEYSEAEGRMKRKVHRKARVSAVFAMEQLRGGDMFCHFHNTRRQINEFTLQTLLRPVFLAVNKLHDHKILHLDLKMENLAFRDEARQQLVIVDFGLAYQLRWPGEMMSPTELFCNNYYPREILDYFASNKTIPQVLTPKVDVYCLGLTLYYLTVGTPRIINFFTVPSRDGPWTPALRQRGFENAESWWQHLSLKWWEARIWQVDCSDEELALARVSRELKDLIISMLRSDPSERVTMQQVLDSPWFRLSPGELEEDLPIITLFRHSSKPAGNDIIQQMKSYDSIVVNPKVQTMKATHLKTDLDQPRQQAQGGVPYAHGKDRRAQQERV